MADYWISDTHLGHKNLVRGCSRWEDKSQCRDFDTIDEHDDLILDNINSVVQPNDILRHCGDFAFGHPSNIIKYRERIRCRNVLLCLGNHDREIRRSKALRGIFQWTGDRIRERFHKRLYITDHYPYQSWEESGHYPRNSYMLHGHCHQNLCHDADGLILDVGVDFRWRPWSREEIDEYMSHRKPVSKDHH